MTMHLNSLNTWHGEVKPTLRRRQLQVLKVLQALGDSTARDVMSATGQPSNVIHPRLGELRDLQYVREKGNRDIGGRKFTIYALTPLGIATDTSKVKDIKPAKKYYSKEDYKAVVREIYDYLSVNLSEPEKADLYTELRNFIATKE